MGFYDLKYKSVSLIDGFRKRRGGLRRDEMGRLGREIR